MAEVRAVLSREMGSTALNRSVNSSSSSSHQMMLSQLSNDDEQLRRINQALGGHDDSIEIVDDGGGGVVSQSQAVNDEDENTTAAARSSELLFKEVSSRLVRGARRDESANQVDYSALSSNRIERFVIEDAKHLLRLFGLPYVESPGEAEAQCAYVNTLIQ